MPFCFPVRAVFVTLLNSSLGRIQNRHMANNHSEIERRLWAAADEFRANSNLRSSEYSTPVLGLIFLRYADHKFTAAEQELKGKGSGRRAIGKEDYQAKGVMSLPPTSRFSHLLSLPEGENIGKAINEAMKAVEAENEELKGVLPKTYTKTIARANRVFRDKINGLIVDYVGVFRNLQKALAIYGSATDGGAKGGECPIQKKDELVEDLRVAIAQARTFCEDRDVDIDSILKADGFQKVAFLDDAATNLVDKQVQEAVDDAVEQVIVNDELKKKFLSLVNQVVRLYKAILPDPSANEFAPIKTCLAVLADKIRTFVEEATIDDVMNQVGELLDESIATKGYVIHATEETSLIDLSQIDFEALKAHFEKGRKRTQAEKLKQAVENKLQQMVQLNKTRTDLMEKFKKLIEEYNKGLDVETFFAKLVSFAQNELSEEDKRAVAEQLSEEELALFDILTKPEIDMTAREKAAVKKVARALLQTLKQAKLVLDWRKKQRTRADVFTTVKSILDELPRAYTPELYQQKCDVVYQHIYDSYQGEGQSIYTTA